MFYVTNLLLIIILLLALIFQLLDEYLLSSIIVASCVLLHYLYVYKMANDIFNPALVPLAIFLLYFLSFDSELIIKEKLLQLYGVVVIVGLVGIYLGLSFQNYVSHHTIRATFILPQKNFLNAVLLVIWIVGFLGFFGIIVQVGIPLLSGNLKTYRIEMQDSIKYFGLLMLMYKSLLAYVYLSVLNIYFSNNRFIKVFSMLGLLMALLMLSMFGNRGLIVFPIFTLLILHNYFYARLTFNKTVLILLIFLMAIGFLGYFRASSGYGVSLENSVERVFHELSIVKHNLYIVLEIFPAKHEFLYGEGFLSALATLLPGKQYLLDWLIKDLSGLTFSGGGVTADFAWSFLFGFWCVWRVCFFVCFRQFIIIFL